VAVDSTSLLMRFTYYADADLSGQVGLPDFTILGNAFGLTNAHWSDGDANYDGVIDLNDFTALATNFGMNQLARGGPPRLQPLYIALLDYPQIYWEARGSRELWAMFEQFESMNLGPIPAMPEGLRSIPEPATGAAVLLAMAATRYRTRRRWA
ncbi:MAG TPA: hypothetical protein PLD59_14900, partial [Tepidisphaeraceae bacterium]|nr:hypothetical protein [Tepidisphaeraceae bacterium]